MLRNKSRMLAILLGVAVCAALLGPGARASLADGSADKPLNARECSPEGPINITLQLKNANIEEGILLRVMFQNSGHEAMSLSVCPNMLLCCVKGLHPLITCEDAGIGLLDVCTVSRPTSHEVYLPVDSAFSFNLNIPSNRLPSACSEKGREISVCVCYEMEDGLSVRSNVIRVAMK